MKIKWFIQATNVWAELVNTDSRWEKYIDIKGRAWQMKFDAVKSGHRIRDAREKAGFSQQLVADRIGLQQPTVHQHEHGKSRPMPESLIWYAENYHVSVDYLLGLTDEPTALYPSDNATPMATAKSSLEASGKGPAYDKHGKLISDCDALPTSRKELEQLIRYLLLGMIDVPKQVVKKEKRP